MADLFITLRQVCFVCGGVYLIDAKRWGNINKEKLKEECRWGLGRAGVRFSFADRGRKAVTVGVFYKKGMEKEKYNTLGFNVLADL